MTRVLIAVDDSDTSLEAARVAHGLFGDAASYLVVNVADSGVNSSIAWGYAYPVAMPMLDVPMTATDPGLDRTLAEDAQQHAADIAESAHLPSPEAVGETGDVASAILQAAHKHEADVIVVGSHERSWFSRLLSGSVATTLVREADIPVLVVR
jgi:nucleotide-binding universal stress UspA family protein